MAATVTEPKWISYLLRDLGAPFIAPISLWYDNKVALHILANLVFHERTKHLDMDCHFIRDEYKKGFILLHHASSIQAKMKN